MTLVGWLTLVVLLKLGIFLQDIAESPYSLQITPSSHHPSPPRPAPLRHAATSCDIVSSWSANTSTDPSFGLIFIINKITTPACWQASPHRGTLLPMIPCGKYFTAHKIREYCNNKWITGRCVCICISLLMRRHFYGKATITSPKVTVTQ